MGASQRGRGIIHFIVRLKDGSMSDPICWASDRDIFYYRHTEDISKVTCGACKTKIGNIRIKKRILIDNTQICNGIDTIRCLLKDSIKHYTEDETKIKESALYESLVKVTPTLCIENISKDVSNPNIFNIVLSGPKFIVRNLVLPTGIHKEYQ